MHFDDIKPFLSIESAPIITIKFICFSALFNYTGWSKSPLTCHTMIKKKLVICKKKCLFILKVHNLGFYFLKITSSICDPSLFWHCCNLEQKFSMTDWQVFREMFCISSRIRAFNSSRVAGSRDVLGRPDRGLSIVEPVSSNFWTHFLIDWIDGALFLCRIL